MSMLHQVRLLIVLNRYSISSVMICDFSLPNNLIVRWILIFGIVLEANITFLAELYKTDLHTKGKLTSYKSYKLTNMVLLLCILYWSVNLKRNPKNLLLLNWLKINDVEFKECMLHVKLTV